MMIDVNELEKGEIIVKGVSAIDRVRRELHISRKVIKQISMHKLNIPLISLCDTWRA